MGDGRTPKQILFGELLRRRPLHGVNKRWHDEVAGDLHAIGVGWFQLCQDHKQCSEICSSAINILAQSRGTVSYAANIFNNLETNCMCGRSFRRKSDLTRHRNFCKATDLSLVQDEES